MSYPRLKYANLEELEAHARPLLSQGAYDYYQSGSEREQTRADNLAAWSRWKLLPRCLLDVQKVDCSLDLFGTKLGMPVLVAPMAAQRLCHEAGERAMAEGAGLQGSAMIVSTMSTCTLPEVAQAGASLWFQLYVFKDRSLTLEMVKKAENSGYKALVLTVDAPQLGKRDVNERNAFALPPGLSLAAVEQAIAERAGRKSSKMARGVKLVVRGAGAETGRDEPADGAPGSLFGAGFNALIDPSLTWKDLAWLCSRTKLPVVLKGVLAPDDARRAVQSGVAGIIVSNHGGRQLDGAPAAVDVLPHVVAAVREAAPARNVPVLVDGGVRRGSDVVKCLALGARAVLVGRPMLWALAMGGARGVAHALELLRSEIRLDMRLLGAASLADITSDVVMPASGQGLCIPTSRL
ncbi:FMN-dependent dehydrogenase [Helicosporidium sp. ATCC 50920]|nr:FMN-dependent dehydrogenase [Helicosporidium sp. ATCC 50920]|eukprot:KDD75237.1 FMN-dependent dehydrogenase [Helicosporidium sp. ATCC 50920]